MLAREGAHPIGENRSFSEFDAGAGTGARRNCAHVKFQKIVVEMPQEMTFKSGVFGKIVFAP
jgi:hypothetical protein